MCTSQERGLGQGKQRPWAGHRPWFRSGISCGPQTPIEERESPFVAEGLGERKSRVGRPGAWESRPDWNRGPRETADRDTHKAEVTPGCPGPSPGSQICLVWLSVRFFKKGKPGADI